MTTGVRRYQKNKPFWILLKQRQWGSSGISWTICKSFAPRSRQMTMPAPRHSSFLWAGYSCCRPTNSIKALRASIETWCWITGIMKFLCAAFSKVLVKFRCISCFDWRCQENMSWCTGTGGGLSGLWPSRQPVACAVQRLANRQCLGAGNMPRCRVSCDDFKQRSSARVYTSNLAPCTCKTHCCQLHSMKAVQ